MCIPYINIVMIVWATNLLSKKFGKNEGFTLGLIFLPFIFLPILAFGDSRYQAGASTTSKKSQGFNALDIVNKQSKVINSADSFEEIISPSSNKNISSKELFNQSNQLEVAESKSQNNDEKYEEEFLEELNSFDYKALEKKYEIELGDDAMDYWYKFVVDRARFDRESLEVLEKKETEEDKLLTNIYGHADEYGKKHINQSFEFKRTHVLIRILSYGHIYSCLVNLESKILNKKSKPCSEEYKKDVRFRLIHAKASVYGTIKFALFSNIKKEEIKEWFPLFEDDEKLIKGKNSLEETIQKLVGSGDDPNNENLEKIKGIHDGAKRIPLYELSEKQRENVPSWFQGPFYKRGGKVTSKATGKEFKLNALEKSIFTELQYNTAIIEIFSENSDRSFFSNPFFSYMVTVVDEGTEWFKNNNPKAYNTLFEDSENSNKIKFCPNCGAKCENDKFCGDCGEKIL